ncbi:MAG: hypothetical protein IPK98_18765 [Chloracidobacterium sp.]|nr:hypothetical protein [Chloracidobacterium sp.]
MRDIIGEFQAPFANDMTEFICRLGTPSGEIVTRIVEATAASEARTRLESEGFRVFAVSNANEGLSAMISGGSKRARLNRLSFCYSTNSYLHF